MKQKFSVPEYNREFWLLKISLIVGIISSMLYASFAILTVEEEDRNLTQFDSLSILSIILYSPYPHDSVAGELYANLLFCL